MISVLNSIISMIGGSNEEDTTNKSRIINVLKKRNLNYSETLSGIKLDFQDDFNVIIPLNIMNNNIIQIKKNLKNKKGESINSVYVYKMIHNKLKFINRIKILDLNNVKIDQNPERVDPNLLNLLNLILNEIFSTKKIATGSPESVTRSDKIDAKYLEYKSKYNNLKKAVEEAHSDTTKSSTQSSSS
jgi:hypothetical protein